MSAAWFRIGRRDDEERPAAVRRRVRAAHALPRAQPEPRGRALRPRQLFASRVQGRRPRRGAPPNGDPARPEHRARSLRLAGVLEKRGDPDGAIRALLEYVRLSGDRDGSGKKRAPPRFSRRRRTAAARRSPTRRLRRGFPLPLVAPAPRPRGDLTRLHRVRAAAAHPVRPHAGRQARSYVVGQAFFEQAKWGRGAAAYRAAVEKDPEMSEAWYQIGLAEMAKACGQRCEAAYGPLKRCLELNPDHADAHVLRQAPAGRARGLAPRRGPPRGDPASTRTLRPTAASPPSSRSEATWTGRSARCSRTSACRATPRATASARRRASEKKKNGGSVAEPDAEAQARFPLLSSRLAPRLRATSCGSRAHRPPPTVRRAHGGTGALRRGRGVLASAEVRRGGRGVSRVAEKDRRDERGVVRIGVAKTAKNGEVACEALVQAVQALRRARPKPRGRALLPRRRAADVREAYVRAEEHLRAIRLDPKVAPARFSLASLLQQRGDVVGAIREMLAYATLSGRPRRQRQSVPRAAASDEGPRGEAHLRGRGAPSLPLPVACAPPPPFSPPITPAACDLA